MPSRASPDQRNGESDWHCKAPSPAHPSIIPFARMWPQVLWQRHLFADDLLGGDVPERGQDAVTYDLVAPAVEPEASPLGTCRGVGEEQCLSLDQQREQPD